MTTKKFIPAIASNNTIKIFDASTGQLHRVIAVEGEVISQPVCLDSEMYVTVKRGEHTSIKYYSLPNGGLKKTQPL
jgi:hypothetical protein